MQLTLGVLRRKKHALSLLAAFTIHGPMLIAKMIARFQAIGRDDLEMPNYQAVLEEFKTRVEIVYRKLEEADDAHLAEVANDRRLRRIRDENTLELNATMTDMSITVDRSYGPGSAEETLGLGPGLRAIPDHTHDVGRRASAKLGHPDFAFPTPSLQGVDLIAADLKTQIDGPLLKLGDALKNLRREKRKYNESLIYKQQVIVEFDGETSVATDWFKVSLRSVGEDELAARVRDKVPRPAKKEDDDKVVESDDPAASADGESTDGGADGDSTDGSTGGDSSKSDSSKSDSSKSDSSKSDSSKSDSSKSDSDGAEASSSTVAAA